MKKSFKALSLLLCVAMVLGMIPAIGIAASAETAEKFANSQLTIATEKASTLAPGITQDAYTVYDSNGDQVKMFITTADMSVDTVKLFASYKDMDPTNYGMSKLTEQVASFNEKAAAGDEYYQGTVVAGINASYYNMVTGKPTGTFVMNGIDVTTESEGNAYGYFAVMKDGSVKIGNKGDYSADKGNIQEAIGIYTMLIVDGEIVSGLNTTQKYPRQTIGITAEGNVILMTADGNQAPKSIGLTVLEQAQVMLDLGCVWAGHLDGGGSCTYASKPEGSDDFVITNSPSDGSERSVSNGFIMVSTAAASYSFDHVVYEAESSYMTPGTSVSVAVSGVSSTGNAAELPTDITYVTTNGTYANGVFTAGSESGEATITAMYNGAEAGTVTLNVVQPDALTLKADTITVPYGKTVDLGVSASYGASAVTIKASDLSFSLSNTAAGTISGFKFTACDESAAETGSDLTISLAADPTVSVSAVIALGKGSEVVQDFETGVLPSYTFGTGYPQYGPMGSTKDENGNYYYNGQNEIGSLEIVTAENGQVHGGKYAMAVHCDYTQIYETGYHQLQLGGLGLTIPANATAFGLWVYLPELEDVAALKCRFVGRDSSDTVNVNAYWISEGAALLLEHNGWYYFSTDVSAVGESSVNQLQIYITDRDQSGNNYTFSDNASVNSKFTMYFDDITIDYSSAVDDRNAPTFGSVNLGYEGIPDAVVMNGQTIDKNVISVSVKASDDNAGLDYSTAKVFVDGVEITNNVTVNADGVIAAENVTLADGVHTIKFEVQDNMGNKSSIKRQVSIAANSDLPTISIVPQNPDADKILIGSLYWVDLVADNAQNVSSVKVSFNLNGVSRWELDHMVVTAGFEASYEYDAINNNATITVTKVGKVAEDATVLVQIPIRTWESRLTEYEGYEAQTPAKLWSRKIIWPMDIKLSTNYGAVVFADGTTGSFSMAPIEVITELYGNYAELNANGDYSNKTSWHIHTAEAMADKAATCTEAGYTGRTYCAVCDSVVDWGTTIPATGHSYAVTDGVLKCGCGETFSGVYTDGKTYADGIIVSGWSGESYYVDGMKLTGLQLVDGYYYLFDENGVCPGKARADGFIYNDAAGAYMYMMGGVAAKGDVAINLVVHFFDENGLAFNGEQDVLGYTCTFDEKGVFVSSEDASVVMAGLIGTNLQFVLLADGTLVIDGQGDMRDYTVSGDYGPWFYDYMASVKAVKIGAGVTRIGEYAFNRSEYITSVTIAAGSKLESIGIYAFRACHRLNNINIPASVETIENYAFFKCGGLVDITFEAGSSLNYIGREAFAETHYLKQIAIPASVMTIGDRLFARSKASVVMQVVEESMAYYYAVDNGISYELVEGTVPPMASGDCSSTVAWALYPNGTLAITGSGDMPNYASQAGQPWASVRHLVKKIVIGKDITSIGNYAFAYCEYNEAIVFEEGSKLEKIGVLSFRSNKLVTEVILPDSVNYLNTYAFGTCTSLVNVYIPQGMGFMHAKAFVESTNVVLDVADGSYGEEYAVATGINHTVRDFVYIAIASGTCGENATWAFYENGELIISGSGAIDNYASHNGQPWAAIRHLVKKIVIGKDITVIGNYAFAYCEYLEEIVFEEGSKLEKIGVLSFRTARKLTEVVLPETVNYLNAYAFGTCPSLVNVYIPQGMGFMHAKAFLESANVNLNVAEGTYAETYAVANGIGHTVRDFVYIAIASGTCGENATWAFYENGELIISGSGAIDNYASQKEQPWAAIRHLVKKIVIGKDITVIGNYAFAYCEYTEEIVFEEGSKLEKIGVLSFRTARKVTEVILPETVTFLNAYAFGTCPSLVNVYIPQSMSYLHPKAFIESTNVNLNVAEGTYAEDYAVANGINHTVRDFEYIAIASGTCGENATWAFYENGELIISGSGAIADYASHKDQPWASIRHLVKKIVIGKDITAIGNYAFAYCEYNEAIVFEEGSKLEKIGVLSFRSNKKVTELVLPETVTYLSAYAFGTCTSLVNVYIPAGMSFMQSKAFTESTNVVLNVAAGSYAEALAIELGIAYTTR